MNQMISFSPRVRFLPKSSVRRWLFLASLLSVFLGGCSSAPEKPTLSVQLQPLEWVSDATRLTPKVRNELIHWLANYPPRDVLLNVTTRSKALQEDISQLLIEQGVKAWQVSPKHQIKAASKSGALVITGVWLQRTLKACHGFGCASQYNLMASVADPRDLIRGKALAAPLAEHDLRALSTYLGRTADGGSDTAPISLGDGSSGEHGH